MKAFLDDNFVLDNESAQLLYHDYAKDMPIIDYHSHLPPAEIAKNKQFDNIAQIWLNGDHYKWRAMRANGISEEFVTGKASDWEKFQKWAATVPYTLRNPLYHWTHLELQRYFGITELLDDKSAESIYKKTSESFAQDEYRVHGLLQKMNVETVCTTDDPIDTLEYHAAATTSGTPTKVLPTWRPDKVLAIEQPEAYTEYLAKLEEAADLSISSYSDLLSALKKRHDYFAAVGCKLSDYGLSEFYVAEYAETEVETIFNKARDGKPITKDEADKFKSALLFELAAMDCESGWTQQFHIGPIRNNSSRLFKSYGPDAGGDSIGDFSFAESMSKFLDRLDSEGKLAKTILYNINPKDNEMMAAMIGNFQDGTTPGKIQYGSGWWFLDQKDGMERQLNALSTQGLLSRFVGMLTDSRSFLSFPRHEYFRRILCNVLGTDIEKGLLPNDMQMIGKMVQDICYNNAKSYFNF